MTTNLEATDPESMTTLQAIEAALIQRAQNQNLTLPAFAGQNLAGKQSLDEFADHLRELARTLRNNGDKIACHPPCGAEDDCPPCDSWKLERYKEHLEYLRTSKTRISRNGFAGE